MRVQGGYPQVTQVISPHSARLLITQNLQETLVYLIPSRPALAGPPARRPRPLRTGQNLHPINNDGNGGYAE